jgi:hypothetical protein
MKKPAQAFFASRARATLGLATDSVDHLPTADPKKETKFVQGPLSQQPLQ